MVYEKLPFQIEDADQEIRKKHFPNMLIDLEGILVGPKKYFLCPSYKEAGLGIYNFQARKDDVYLCGFPRSGTTLYSELVWLLGNDLDYKTAKATLLNDRFVHLDSAIIQTELTLPHYHLFVEHLAQMTGKRFLKAHLPLTLLPPSIAEVGSKVIYVARNPKDTIVSNYYVRKMFYDNEDVVGSFAQYFKSIKMNWGMFLPYFEHVKEGWNRRHEENFLFLFYEDYLKDNRNTILKIAEFFDKKLTDPQIEELISHLNITSFKSNKAINLDHIKELGVRTKIEFIRKGGSGGWRNYFVGPLLEEADAWIEENLKDTDLRFPE